MEDKETPIFITRTFRCPNCESRNLKWEKWGSDPDVKKKIWQDIQYSCCADCHKIIPSKLAYDQYTYPPCFTTPQGIKISMFRYSKSPINPPRTPIYLYTPTPRYQYTTIPLYLGTRYHYLGTNIGIILRARGLLGSLVGFPPFA